MTAVVGFNTSTSTWAAAERYVYDPYGAVTMYDGPGSTGGDWSNPHTVSSVGNTLLYAGTVLNPTTGLYYDEARWYSTAVSTFISRDPARADENLYRYCGNAPTQATDPSGLDDIGLAGKGQNTSIADWFSKNIWPQFQTHGANQADEQKLLATLQAGCVGLTTLLIGGKQYYPKDPNTGANLAPLPDMSHGFLKFEDAKNYRDKLDKEKTVAWKGFTISGNRPCWRIFAVVYSSKNMTYPSVDPKLNSDGSGAYDLTSNGVLLTIVDQSRPKATNFDFFLYSEPKDPWYNPTHPWLHATTGGPDMVLEAAAQSGPQDELSHNHSDFDRLYYCVAPERQYGQTH